MRREMLCAIPPLFYDGKIFCLALTISEYYDSGQDPGLADMAKRREIQIDLRTILGRDMEGFPDSLYGFNLGLENKKGPENVRFTSGHSV